MAVRTVSEIWAISPSEIHTLLGFVSSIRADSDVVHGYRLKQISGGFQKVHINGSSVSFRPNLHIGPSSRGTI